MADFKGKARDKNVLDSKRVNLSVPCPVKGVKGWSTLYYYANNDNPGILVYTGDPNDKENDFGRIKAKFGLMDLMTHIEQLEAVINSKEPIKMSAVCRTMRGGQGNLKMIDSVRVEVGKNPGGVVYIVLEDLENQNRPLIHFPFAPTRFHHFQINGEPMSEATASIFVAKGIVRLMSQLVPMISKDTYKHPEPKQQNGGGGGGGGYGGGQRQGGGGGYGGGQQQRQGGGGGGRGYEAGGDSGATEEDVPW